MSAREIEIARRHRHEHDRANYVTRHAALRLILARYLKAPPASLVFSEETNGRPILAGPAARLHFNLSSSGDIALLAVSCVAPVGVDVEKVREIADVLALARDHFAPTEFDDLNRLAPEERLFSFFVTWTRKEAFVKATGLGLSFPLDGFSTGRTDSPAAVDVGGARDKNWTMKDLVRVRAMPGRSRSINLASRSVAGGPTGRGCSIRQTEALIARPNFSDTAESRCIP